MNLASVINESPAIHRVRDGGDYGVFLSVMQ